MEEIKKNEKKLFRGTVISDAMDKTVIVKFERTYQNPHTKKIMRSFKNYKVHDELKQARIGDIIEFYEGRPKSKTKYMYLDRVIH